MLRLRNGLVKGKYCLICTPRSGSFYLQRYIHKHFNLEFGKEWFGRNKEIDYSDPTKLKTSPVDIDWTVNENLLTNAEMSKRLKFLDQFEKPFIVKCMPLQLTNTVENHNLPEKERLDIAYDILSKFDVVYQWTDNKVSQFCFELTAQHSSQKGYTGTDREFSVYETDKRTIPDENTFTATKEKFDTFMDRENFTHSLLQKFYKNGTEVPIIRWIDFLESPNREMLKLEYCWDLIGNYKEKHWKEIIPNPDYSKIFTNYQEITEWFWPNINKHWSEYQHF